LTYQAKIGISAPHFDNDSRWLRLVRDVGPAGGRWFPTVVGNTFGGQIMVSSGRIFLAKKRLTGPINDDRFFTAPYADLDVL
jgi:hypothetical protein